jgi:hypothetical protein
MKRIRILGLCIIAMLVVGAVAAAVASAAQPEYAACVKVKGGKFEKGCAKEGGKGGYALEPVTEPESLTGKAGVTVFDVFVPGMGVVGTTECQKAKIKGEIVSPTEEEVVVTYEKCSSSGKACTSVAAGTKRGDIVTSALIGKPVFIEGGTGVGDTLSPKGGGNVAEYNCEGEEVATTGSITAEYTEMIGEAAKKTGVRFTVNADGEPAIPTEGSRDTLLSTIKGVGTLPSGETSWWSELMAKILRILASDE